LNEPANSPSFGNLQQDSHQRNIQQASQSTPQRQRQAKRILQDNQHNFPNEEQESLAPNDLNLPRSFSPFNNEREISESFNESLKGDSKDLTNSNEQQQQSTRIIREEEKVRRYTSRKRKKPQPYWKVQQNLNSTTLSTEIEPKTP
jgi:hypothetical protein